MNTPTKRCTKCGRILPNTLEYFAKHGARLRPDCKDCRSEQRRARYRKDPEKELRKNRAYYQSHKDEHHEMVRKWRTEHPEYGAIYYARHRDQERARGREKYLKHRAKYPQYSREYYQRTKGKHQARCAEWRRNNPDKTRVYTLNYQARKKQAEGSHTADDVQRQYSAQKGKCYWCGRKVGDLYHVDHVIPVSRGGSNGPENLVIACPQCNQSKGDKLPHEWHGNNGKLL